MRQRILIPAAVAAAGLAGGALAVGGWELLDDPQPVSTAAGSAATTAADRSGSSSLAELYRQAAPAVVEISRSADEGFNPFDEQDELEPGATGSGFVIDDEGHIVTNEHVVGNAERVTVRFANGDEAQARVVGSDASTDVALLDLEGNRDVTPLELGTAESLEVGDAVAAIGSPFGLEGTLTAGIVSALDREIRAPNGFTIDGAIQTDAAVNGGSSGGPLLDAEGRVVGIVSQIESENGGNVGIGYAVPIETAKNVVDQLLEGGEVQHAFLGVSLDDEAPDGGGARVSEVVDGGPADDAGLRAGDVIEAVGGDDVETPDQVRAAVESHDPGDSVEVRVRRDGDTRTFDVELGDRPNRIG